MKQCSSTVILPYKIQHKMCNRLLQTTVRARAHITLKLKYLYRIYVSIRTRNKLTVGIYVLLYVSIYCLSVHTHTTWLRKWLLTGSSSTSQIWASKNSIYIWSTLYTYTSESSWNQNSNILEPDRPKHGHSSSCYHPAVFSHHLYLIVPPFPQGIIWCTFKKCYWFFFSLAFLKLCKSEIV